MPWRTTAALSLALLAGCGDAGGEDEPDPIRADTLVVYSSLPRSGAAGPLGEAVAAGQRLALADAGGRVGRHRIKLVELDSAEADERDWDPDLVEKNAERAADDPAAIAYLGELDLGASAISLPVTNEASMLQVSPTDGLTSLTVPQTGAGAGPGSEPERFYPTRVLNFLRLVPPDAAQAGALVAIARETGAAELALAHDGGIFGRQLAGAVEQAAADRGLDVTAVERVQPDPDEVPALARHLTRESPDAVIYQGVGGDPAATLVAAMSEAGLAGVPLIAAGPMAKPGALPGGGGDGALEVVSPMLPVESYPPAGRRILRRLQGTRDSAPPVEALYGYESMRVVLRALRVAAGRAADRHAVIDAARAGGSRGSVIGRYRFDSRGDTTRRRLALYSLEGGRLVYRGPAPGSGP